MEKGVLENRISHKTLNLCITNSVISVKCMNTDKKSQKTTNQQTTSSK